MITREDLAREAGCLDLVVPQPGPNGRVAVGPVAEMPPLAFSTGTTRVNLTGGWKSVRPLYQEKRAPCGEGCPAGEDVARYLRAVQHGRYEEGWRLIMQDNPFPSVMGRVCYHPCEAVCSRGRYDEPVAIHAVERFLGDYGLAHRLRQMVYQPNGTIVLDSTLLAMVESGRSSWIPRCSPWWMSPRVSCPAAGCS